jgi:hypothetical protein
MTLNSATLSKSSLETKRLSPKCRTLPARSSHRLPHWVFSSSTAGSQDPDGRSFRRGLSSYLAAPHRLGFRDLSPVAYSCGVVAFRPSGSLHPSRSRLDNFRGVAWQQCGSFSREHASDVSDRGKLNQNSRRVWSSDGGPRQNTRACVYKGLRYCRRLCVPKTSSELMP